MTTDPSATRGAEARPDDDSVVARIEDQIQWYEGKCHINLRWFKTLKTLTIVVATLIPLVAGSTHSQAAGPIAGGLGALIAIIEGIQHLNQFQANWTTYRSACEALRHEKFLYLALAGPYAGSASPGALLAERAESIVFQEHAKWSAARDSTPQGAPPQQTNPNQ